jgi:PAS domain S-box-containing protein
MLDPIAAATPSELVEMPEDHPHNLLASACDPKFTSPAVVGLDGELTRQESYNLIEQIAQASPHILYLYDLQKECNVYVNQQISTILGYTPAAIQAMGASLFTTLIHPDDLLLIPAQYAQIAAAQDGEILEFEYRMKRANGEWCWLLGRNSIFSRDLHGRVQQTIGTAQDITDRKQAEQLIYKQAVQAISLKEITKKIRQSLDLPIILETAVQKIRALLEVDRVGIFKFQSDLNFDEGKFIAESVSAGLEPISDSTIQIPCFGKKLAWYYQRGSINAIEDIYTAEITDHEVQFFAQYQVRATLIVPLIDGSVLWGLICIQQCTAPRLWQKSEIEAIEQIAEQIGIAIQQATLYEKVQLELEIRWHTEAEIAIQLRQQQALATIGQQIRNSLKVAEILATATKQVKELMGVDRVMAIKLLPDGKIQAVEEAVSPEYPQLLGMIWNHDQFSPAAFEFYLQGKPRTVFDVEHDPWSAGLQKELRTAKVQSKIVAPILRPLGNGETQLWGLLIVDACRYRRQWYSAEAKLLQQIADQLAIAIQQANLFEQLQTELLERQQAEAQLRERNQQLAISNQELARATRLKDEFLASMSHELRTPLNAILGMSEALQELNFGPINDRQQKSIATIEKSGKHLLALINDILDLAKIEANKFDLELTDVSIDSLCKNSLLFVKELAHKKQISIKIQLPAYLKQLNIRVDDRRCRQVLINLLSNAVKFTSSGGSILLDVRVEECEQAEDWGMGSLGDISEMSAISQRQIVFSIVDTGIGIAPENIGKLFQSFVQIDSSLNRQYAGTGLGLALVKRIAELHGGAVSVESIVDRGSCFRVLLPFDPRAEIVIPPSLSPLVYPLTADPEDMPTIKPKALILVVEDNEANMETMTGYLRSRGYRLAEATNGQEAIALLSECSQDRTHVNCPDIILMDIQMPGMDGFEATRHIRQLPACATMPIVALTALAMPTDRQKCLDAGANEYVSKPVKLGQLVSTIETLLKSD